MPARDLPYTEPRDIYAAAVLNERVRVRGDLVQRGEGHSGRYRNWWLVFDLGDGALVRVTCTIGGRFSHLEIGQAADFAVTLSGLLDVRTHTFHGERAQLLI